MNEVVFADAVRPPGRRVLRLQLQPFSVGHELLLEGERNLLLTGREVFEQRPIGEQWQSALRAALICSRTWAENQQGARWLRLWGWFARREDLGRAAQAFREYRTEGSRFPVLNPQQGKGRELGSEFMAQLCDYLRPFGPALFDVPLGMAVHMYFANREQEGACDVMNETDREIARQVEEIQGERAERQKDQAE
jgi:hypothetical protein